MFLGHSVTQRKNVSDATAKVIDEEIRRIVEEGEHAARDILTARLDELHALAQGAPQNTRRCRSTRFAASSRASAIVRETSAPSPASDEPRPPAGPPQLGARPPAATSRPVGASNRNPSRAE